MLTVYPSPAVPPGHAAIGAAASRMLLTRPVTSAHAVSELVFLAMVLTIAFLAMAAHIYRQMAALALQLVGQLVHLIAFLGLTLLLMSLGGAILVLILLHA